MTRPLITYDRMLWKQGINSQKSPAALKLCIHPKLKKNRYRVIHFMRHHYLMLYRIEGATVYVDAIYHQLQDYENVFADELNK